MTIEAPLAAVLTAFFALLNTGLLVFQAVKLAKVHGAVNGALAVAVRSATIQGLTAGVAHQDAVSAAAELRAPGTGPSANVPPG